MKSMLECNRRSNAVTTIQRVAALLCVIVVATAGTWAVGQESAVGESVTGESVTGESVAGDTAAGTTAAGADALAADPSTAAAIDGAAEAAAGATGALAEAADSALPGFMLLGIVIALFVLPLLIGGYLSKSLRMPDHGWKFALGVGTLAAAAVVVSLGEIKFGPDLSGGITLIYELQDTAADGDDVVGDLVEDLAEDGDGATVAERSTRAKRQLVKQLIGALSERVDPSGTKEVTIREYGLGQIEIIIPKASQQELAFIERRIYTAGALEFRITASPIFNENREIIELAQALPLGENEVRLGDNKVAEWVAYNVDEFGPVGQKDSRTVKRQVGDRAQALVLMNDGLDITGEFLKKSSSGIDQLGKPQVRFTLNSQGAFRFGRLTGSHLENASGQKYYLGILLDKKLLSAPSIAGKITSQGEITGSMSKEEVDFIVGVLNAGSLPATLNKDPISRETISPTLGAETVTKAKTAISYSLVVVMVFMLFYYRFAGLVACLALGANLVLILGLMVLFHAAFTLPGLAGLVLTIGMSVDANVLIFERIREERKRGAAMRMAIRNGFARATQTIVDANVTTLITAIVIYKIAPDNVKGFGVTLIIGIVMSMYAAIFLSRLVFDVAEKIGNIKELSMLQIIGKTSIDFLGKRSLAAIASLLLIGVGLTAVFNRGADLLNIDFTGGSSVTMVFKEGQEMQFSEVKQLLGEKTELADKNLSLVEVGERGTGKQFTVSCVEQDVLALQETLHVAFAQRLKTYQVTGAELTAMSGVDSAPVAGDPYADGASFTLDFEAGGSDAGISYDTVRQLLQDALDATDHSGAAVSVTNPNFQEGSARRFTSWDIKLALSVDQTSEVIDKLEAAASSQPIFPLANKIGGKVAGDMQTKAVAAIIISLLGIVAYIWFRFQHVMYGLAAVAALIHDVLVTLGMIALSAWLVNSIPGLASSLMIEKFQISLPVVAAFLTIIGYSLNDTIVVFDRIREVKGKSPKLNAEMINSSINQTLSRTLLTSLTTLLSVILLYFLGGDGIHGFAYALVVGVVVGTYSSIFIASPTLLWISQRSGKTAGNRPGARAA